MRKSLDIIKKNRKKPAAAKPLWKPHRPKLSLWAGAGALLILLLLVFTMLPEAGLTLYAHSEPVTRDLEIRVDSRKTEPNVSELVIPGKALEQEVVGQKKAASTGSRNVGKKASGFAHIYNFSKQNLILRAETTVLKANVREYFFTQDLNIRPTARIGLEDQEVDPASLIPPVPLVAGSAGQEYNLAAGARLEIENEVFGHQPQVLYAVATQEGIIGGTTQEVKLVREEDVNAGIESLAQELVQASRENLEKEQASWRLLPSALSTEILERNASAKAGDEASEFEVSVKLKLKALLYSQAQALEVIRERLSRLLPENKELVSGPQDVLKSQFLSVDLAGGQGLLANHFEGQIEFLIDRQEVIEKVKGKNREEIKEILLSRPAIDDVEIKFYPFWVKKAPKFSRKIFIDIR